MGSLATALDKIMTSQDPSTDTDKVLDTGYLDLPANFVQKLRDMTEDIKAMMVDGDYVVNTMSAEEVRKLSQMPNLKGIDLEGKTMYMTPTSAKALMPTNSANIPQRGSEGHKVIVDGKKRIVNSFLMDATGNIAEVNYIDLNGMPYASGGTQFLFAMSYASIF